MIHFQLKCSQDHEFEAWFQTSESFAVQVKRGDVDCPVCGDVKISKALMTPNISTSKKAVEKISEEPAEVRAREVAEQILNAAARLRQVVEENCDYVGDDFAEEARAIHYGEADERGIYGQTTDKKAEDLEDEGIEFVRLPKLSRRTRRKD